MPHRIDDIVSKGIRKELKQLIQTRKHFLSTKITISIPKIDTPQFLFVEQTEPTWTAKKRKKIWRDISDPWESSSQES